IAGEKGGIIKEKIPVVIGEKLPATAAVFEQQAAAKKAPLFYAQDAFVCTHFQFTGFILEVSVRSLADGTIQTYYTDLPGIYQTKNILTVLTAVRLLADWKISD